MFSGVCVLAWATYLKMHFEAVLRLISKVGKLPTDTLCMRELGIPRDKIAPFLQSSTTLLTTILDACAERPQIKFIRRHETLWRGGGTGLVAVATTRTVPAEEMVLIHYHVNIFFHMASALELKEKNLFCSLLDALVSHFVLFVDQVPNHFVRNRICLGNLRNDQRQPYTTLAWLKTWPGFCSVPCQHLLKLSIKLKRVTGLSVWIRKFQIIGLGCALLWRVRGEYHLMSCASSTFANSIPMALTDLLKM